MLNNVEQLTKQVLGITQFQTLEKQLCMCDNLGSQHQLHIPANKENFMSEKQKEHPITHVKKEKK